MAQQVLELKKEISKLQGDMTKLLERVNADPFNLTEDDIGLLKTQLEVPQC